MFNHYRTGGNDDQTYVRMIRRMNNDSATDTQIGDAVLVRSRGGHTLTTIPFTDTIPSSGTVSYRPQLSKYGGAAVFTYGHVSAVLAMK
jgi:hypothetical protein